MRQARPRLQIAQRLSTLEAAFARRAVMPAAAPAIPRRNVIDVEIFNTLAAHNVTPAALSTDQEFVRRIYLDLTGRIPSPDDVRNFLANGSPGRRDDLIDRLIYSPEFEDRWIMWLGDLLQNASAATNVNRRVGGRDAFYNWIKGSVVANKSLKEIAHEAIAATGNSFDVRTGAANFAVSATTPMGPVQDMYDTMLVRTATAFMGLAYYDCLLCHGGRGHLDQISLWGSRTTRGEAQQMAAFFSRMRIRRDAAAQGEPLYNSYNVTNAPSGTYDLNTNYGNRPNRTPLGNVSNLTPQYRLGGTPAAGANWREAFAAEMTADPMFARNIVNRLWKHFFGLALVDPVDTLDPARLDPSNPPPEPWTLQATHPELLEQLARELTRGGFNLREIVRTITASSAYQLSSRYSGEWKYSSVPLFARHYPRRLEAEEVADAISKATGVMGNYNIGWANPVSWAMQLPETGVPRGAVGNFLDSFFRGNRDTRPRSQSGSILQQLNLMNDTFVLNRIRVSASPTLQAVSRLAGDGAAVDEMFLLFLSRYPDDYERGQAMEYLRKAASPAARNAAIEDLAWACVNKVDFLFSY
ncbi:MAG TPA: DUF1553 domain-containing protein [Bryobacteraceae bacterium]|nr:DUF1553 domain-containing protein [Bryobacteraceae bacterium]